MENKAVKKPTVDIQRMNGQLDDGVFVAGHNGMVGRAIVRELEQAGRTNIITRSRTELDLCNQAAVAEFFNTTPIKQVYLAAAKVGGIHANSTYPADFIYQNLMVQNNVIHAAYTSGVNQLLFLGSSCIYPKLAEQPMVEAALLTGPLEATNEPYAIAKIAGIKLCEAYNRQHGCDYRSVMPTNLYGPYDNFHAENSHVIPGMIHKFDEALRGGSEKIILWGTGTPKREFLHVDDMAAASVHIMELGRDAYAQCIGPDGTHVNVGTGEDCEIRQLAALLKTISGFQGELEFDTSRPDGTPRKLLDVSILHASGWQHSIALEDGLQSAWDWYQDNRDELRRI